MRKLGEVDHLSVNCYNSKNDQRVNVTFVYRVHAIERMFQRSISEEMVENTIRHGEIIETYLDDKPYPSFLVLGFKKDDSEQPIHVVFAKNDDECIIITAYQPDASKWTDHYRRRIEK